MWLRDKLYTAVPHYNSPQSFFWQWTAAQKTSSSAIVWCSSCGVFLSLHWVQAVVFVCACNLLRLFVCFVLWMLVGFCMCCLFSFFLFSSFLSFSWCAGDLSCSGFFLHSGSGVTHFRLNASYLTWGSTANLTRTHMHKHSCMCKHTWIQYKNNSTHPLLKNYSPSCSCVFFSPITSGFFCFVFEEQHLLPAITALSQLQLLPRFVFIAFCVVCLSSSDALFLSL